MNVLLSVFAAMFFVGAVSACAPGPTSEHPLGPPGAVDDDPLLAGAWHGANPEGGRVYLEFNPREAGGFSVVGIVTNSEDDELPLIFSHYRAHATELDGRTYYNLLTLLGWPDEIWTEFGDKYFIAGYEIVDDRLFLNLMNVDLFKAAIIDGRLAGTVQDDGFFHLHVDGETLVDYIREVGADAAFAIRFGPLHRRDESLPFFELEMEDVP